LFQDAAAILTGGTGSAAAERFVRRLWGGEAYARPGIRSALLQLAARCADCFPLRLPHAPGGFAYGAMIAPQAFGIDAPMASAGGRGLSLTQAFESARGEAAEHLSALEWPDDPLLRAASASAAPVDADWTARLRTGPSGDLVSVADWAGTEERSVPADVVLRRGGAAFRPASTGLAAGQTYAAARLAGLLEIVERDAVRRWWGGHTDGRRVEIAETDALARSLRDRTRPWWYLDITADDVGIPVMLCVSATPEGTEIVVGAAAALDPATAAQSALLELCQMELARLISISRARESDASRAIDDVWTARDRALSLAQIPSLAGDRQAEDRLPSPLTIGQALQKIHACGLIPWIADLTRPGLDIPVVRVVLTEMRSAENGTAAVRLAAARPETSARLDASRGPVSPI